MNFKRCYLIIVPPGVHSLWAERTLKNNCKIDIQNIIEIPGRCVGTTEGHESFQRVDELNLGFPGCLVIFCGS